MKLLRNAMIALVPVFALGACTTLSEQDRATLSTASQNAAQAKTMAQQALDTANSAKASADKATQVANQAEADAKAANEKADRIFQRSLRK